MIVSQSDRRISVILLDIEGTTVPVDFVYQTLFPYARKHIKAFLEERKSSQDVQSDIALLRAEYREDLLRGLEPPLWEESEEPEVQAIAAYAQWLMDQDRKSTGLKSLQGKIWLQGYQAGQLLGTVFEDVLPAFERWQREKRRICMYSSGSVLAQKLLFANTTEGDLTVFIAEYFDTNIGSKIEVESYRRISASLNQPPDEILFISDTIAELDAAEIAGMRTLCSSRPGNHPLSSAPKHEIIRNFDQVVLA